jgi:hypothetical protein
MGQMRHILLDKRDPFRKTGSERLISCLVFVLITPVNPVKYRSQVDRVLWCRQKAKAAASRRAVQATLALRKSFSACSISFAMALFLLPPILASTSPACKTLTIGFSHQRIPPSAKNLHATKQRTRALSRIKN